jgi:hypothetical protein
MSTTEATIGSVWRVASPIICSCVITAIETCYLQVLEAAQLFGDDEYNFAPNSFMFASLTVGLCIAVLGLSSIRLNPLFLFLCAFLTATAGYTLLAVVDNKLTDGDYLPVTVPNSRRVYAMIVLGFILLEAAASLLQLIGRTELLRTFSANSQISAQAWTTCLSLSATFVLKLIVGLVIRSENKTVLDPKLTRWATLVVLGIAVIELSVVFIGKGRTDPEPGGFDLQTLGDIEQIPEVFSIGAPLFLVSIAYVAIEVSAPLAAYTLARADPVSENYGLAIVASGCCALLGTCGGWLPAWLGIRGGMVVSLAFSSVVLALDVFAATPYSRTFVLVTMTLSGVGMGAALSAGWAALALTAPTGQAQKLVALFVGINGALKVVGFPAITIAGSPLNTHVYMPFLLIVALVLSFKFPEPGAKPNPPRYDNVAAAPLV